MLARTARKHKLSIFTVIPMPEKLYMVNLAIQLGFVPSDEKTVSGFRNCGQISIDRIARNKWRSFDALR